MQLSTWSMLFQCVLASDEMVVIWIPETIALKTKDEFSTNSIASQFEKRIHWFGLVLQ